MKKRTARAEALRRLACLMEFVSGAPLEDIGKRHGLNPRETEELLRRGLYDFGFAAGAGTVAPRPPRQRPSERTQTSSQ